jgi:hypothetical protein
MMNNNVNYFVINQKHYLLELKTFTYNMNLIIIVLFNNIFKIIFISILKSINNVNLFTLFYGINP